MLASGVSGSLPALLQAVLGPLALQAHCQSGTSKAVCLGNTMPREVNDRKKLGLQAALAEAGGKGRLELLCCCTVLAVAAAADGTTVTTRELATESAYVYRKTKTTETVTYARGWSFTGEAQLIQSLGWC